MTNTVQPKAAAAPVTIAKLSPEATGAALGIAAAMIWGAYLAMARAGISSGLVSSDIALIRYGVAGLIMLPWLLRHDPLSLAGVGVWRSLALATFAGPLFILIGAGGYRFAPLAHGAVLQPAAVTVGAMIAATILFGERMTAARVIGSGTILCGLAVIAGPDLFHASATTPVGDAMFIAAGVMWAIFSILSKRWGVTPVAATAVVSVLSAVIYVPVYLLTTGVGHLAAISTNILVPQILVQGVLSGVVAVIAYSRAVQLLGPGRAAVFPALVPAAAIMIGVPIVGEWPTSLHAAGLAVVTTGLLISIGVLRRPSWWR
jgi:drug/metabolite transporter (DMT)-like permease